MAAKSETLAAVKTHLERLIGFNTTSRLSNMELIEFIAEYLRSAGLEAKIFPDETGKKANLFATVAGAGDSGGHGGIVLSGHTDVVPVEGQAWTSDPFRMVERDGKLIGRGTADMKGFIAVCLAMLPRMQAAPLREPLHFAFSYDEEVGCRGVASMIDDIVKAGLNPRACIVGEPTSMEIVSAHKAINAYRTAIVGRECHSSNTEFGVSAVEAGVKLVSHLMGLAEAEKQNPDPASHMDPPYTTLNVGTFTGGTAINIVPNQCEFIWEYRTLPGRSVDAIIDSLTDYAHNTVLPDMQARFPEASIMTEELARAPALLPEKEGAAEQLVKALTGQNTTKAWAAATEAGHFQTAGISTVVFGPGHLEQAHRPDEYVELSQLEDAIIFMDKLIDGLRT